MSNLRDVGKRDVEKYDSHDVDAEAVGSVEAGDAELLRNVRIFTTPTATFNPLTASERELLAYGLPARPNARTHPRLAEKWQRVADRHLEFITPQLRVNGSIRRSGVRNLTERGDISAAELARFGDRVAKRLGHDRVDEISRVGYKALLPQTSTNWSGAYVKRPSAEPLVSVTGEWTVPGVNPPSSAWNGTGYNDGTYLCFVWVGIDGTQGTNDVMQAGTGSQCVVSGGKMISTSFFAWTEWFSLPSVTVSNYPVQVGDLISCTVCAPFGNTHGSVLFNNLTSGATTNLGIDPPAGVALAGNVAEWIVEDPGLGATTLYPFPNYGSTYFSDCSAGSKNIEVDLGAATMVDLVNVSNTVVSSGLIENDRTLFCRYGAL